jgi:hypothetical protein
MADLGLSTVSLNDDLDRQPVPSVLVIYGQSRYSERNGNVNYLRQLVCTVHGCCNYHGRGET